MITDIIINLIFALLISITAPIVSTLDLLIELCSCLRRLCSGKRAGKNKERLHALVRSFCRLYFKKRDGERKRHTHARCICGWKWPKEENLHDSLVGYPVGCPKCCSTAYVVKFEDDIGWIIVRYLLFRLQEPRSPNETRNTWWRKTIVFLQQPKRLKGRAETIISARIFVILIFACILTYQVPGWILLLLSSFLLWMVLYTTIHMLTTAFVSRWQKDILRTFVLWLLNYLQVVIAFGCIYLMYSHQFKGELRSFWDSIYFSAVTITTLGYGDITPICGWTRFLVFTELSIGLIFVAAILTTLIGEITRIPDYKQALTPELLRYESMNRGKIVCEPFDGNDLDY